MAFVWFMKSGIAMKPLSVGDGVEFFQKPSHPFVRFLVGGTLTIMSGLDHTPLLGRQSKKEIVPPNRILCENGITDIRGEQQWVSHQVWATEVLQALKDCHLEEWVGVFFCLVSFKGSEIGFPWFISFFCTTRKHMLCCFRLVTARTAVVGLLVPKLKGGTHTTVSRGVLGDWSAVTQCQRAHGVLASIPVDIGDGIGWESTRVVVMIFGPTVSGVMVLKEGINDIRMSTAELVALMPNGVAFVSNVEHWGNH